MIIGSLTKRHPSKTFVKQYCDTMDEMYAIYDATGRRRDDPKKNTPENVMIRAPSTWSHAKAIVKIYEEIYQGTYPFHGFGGFARGRLLL
jgi:hypothetical protein